MNVKRWGMLALAIVFASLLPLSSPLEAATGSSGSYIDWHTGTRKVSARIQSWPLDRVLAKVAAATGWDVFVEPDLGVTVSVEFKDLSVNDALGRLLGQLNFALLPQPDAPTKLFIYRTSAGKATEKIKASSGNAGAKNLHGRIPNELIVTLKPGSGQKIEDIAKRLGAKVVGRIDGLNAYRLQFADEASADAARLTLASDGDVAGVDSNYEISRPTQIQPLKGSSAQPPDLKVSFKPDPNRLVIGLVDTAVQVPASGIKDFLLSPISVVGEATSVSGDSPSHGTVMAETIVDGMALAGNSKDGTTTRILNVNVYGNNETTTMFTVAQGVAMAVNNGATIINMSLAGEGDSTYFHQLIQQLHDQGVVFVAAAGNEPTTAPMSPAQYPEVISVTASDKGGNIASFANRSSTVDVIAPGLSVISFNNMSYIAIGTSSSTAYISGMIAGLASSSGKTAIQVENIARNMWAYKPSPKP